MGSRHRLVSRRVPDTESRHSAVYGLLQNSQREWKPTHCFRVNVGAVGGLEYGCFCLCGCGVVLGCLEGGGGLASF